jgi:hypothetical protein
LESTSGASSANVADLDISTFYNTIPGVSSTLVSGTVTSETLLGVDLFVSLLPDDPFSASEITALRDFLSASGTVFFLGENNHSFFTNPNDIINSVLTDLGSGMAIVPDAFDSYAEALGSQIATDPFTAGVGSFHYSVTSEVSGGTGLFFGSGQQPFISYGIAVPEPSALLMFIISFLGLGSRCRRRCRVPRAEAASTTSAVGVRASFWAFRSGLSVVRRIARKVRLSVPRARLEARPLPATGCSAP